MSYRIRWRPIRWRPWMFGSAVWIAPAVFAMVSEVGQRRLRGQPPAALADLLFTGGDWLIYGLVSPVIFAACNRWPVVRPIVRQRVMLHVGFAFLTAIAWAVGGKIMEFGINFALRPDEARQFVASLGPNTAQGIALNVLGWIFVTLPFGMIVYTCVAVLAHAVQYLSDAREREVQLARVSEQLSSARFAALQAQLNPHFLFNALNTIAVRARDGDGPGTARMVEQLSDLLRRTLGRHRSSEVTLEEELDLVRQYVAIEEARFPDRLVVTIDADPTVLAAAVPGFALQHLVENAIRHGIARRPGGGSVNVSARREAGSLVLVVQDDGAGMHDAAVLPAGHGLENTRERLRVLYGTTASLEVRGIPAGGTIATIRVPYRELAMEADIAQR